MKTSLTARNLIGAFVGGVVGILTCYYVSLAFMPLGCLIGVVLGFWHDKLLLDYRKNILITNRLLSVYFAKLEAWKDGVMINLKRPVEYLRQLYLQIPKGWGIGTHLMRFTLWLISLPVLFVAWLRRHPMNRADAITCLIAPAVLFVLARTSYFSYILGDKSLVEKATSFPIQFAWFGMLMGTFMLLFFPFMVIILGREDTGMRGFYRQYSRYSRYGASVWAIFQMKNLVMFYLYGFIFCQIFLSAVFVAVALIILTLALIVTVVIPARVFWKCVQLPGHWFCFGSTVLATCATWLIGHNHITNPAMAWMLALANGIFAAVITEGLRRVYLLMVSKIVWLYELTHMDIMGDPEDIFGFLGRTIGMPPLRLCAKVCHRVQSRLPRIRISSNSFWMPV